MTGNCTSVLLILFLVHSTFFKGKVKSGCYILFFYINPAPGSLFGCHGPCAVGNQH